MNPVAEMWVRIAETNGSNAVRFHRAALACEDVSRRLADNPALSADYRKNADDFVHEAGQAAKTAWHAALLAKQNDY